LKKVLISYLIPLLLFPCCSGGGNIPADNKDLSLVVPGKSAEGYTIGEKITASGRNLSTDKESSPPLHKILGIKKFPEISYDSIIYHKDKTVIFTRHNIVTAIAGLNAERRVTDSAVKLSDGADSFILNYGNSGIEIIREGEHTGYLYRNVGIAIFDDYGDDSIDMYLVFIPSEP